MGGEHRFFKGLREISKGIEPHPVILSEDDDLQSGDPVGRKIRIDGRLKNSI
jgi:hypothetical protein